MSNPGEVHVFDAASLNEFYSYPLPRRISDYGVVLRNRLERALLSLCWFESNPDLDKKISDWVHDPFCCTWLYMAGGSYCVNSDRRIDNWLGQYVVKNHLRTMRKLGWVKDGTNNRVISTRRVPPLSATYAWLIRSGWVCHDVDGALHSGLLEAYSRDCCGLKPLDLLPSDPTVPGGLYFQLVGSIIYWGHP